MLFAQKLEKNRCSSIAISEKLPTFALAFRKGAHNEIFERLRTRRKRQGSAAYREQPSDVNSYRNNKRIKQESLAGQTRASGYENAILTYEELREIVQDPTAYESWHTALSTVNAVYLIVDRENGRKYVGSAYGKGGLLGRWTHYVKSLHGDNKLMKELLCDYPDRYTHFQFSILQLLPKAVTPDEVIQTETLWKKKLLTYEPLGMNAN